MNEASGISTARPTTGGTTGPRLPRGRTPKRRWRAVASAAAVLGLAAVAGTGMVGGEADAERAVGIAETAELAAATDLDASQLGAHEGILTARAANDASDALSAAAAVLAAASGKSDASGLEASVAALESFQYLAPERVFALADATRAHAATVEAAVAEFDRVAAEQAAAAAAAQAAAERAAAERAAQPPAGEPAPAAPVNPSEAQVIARDMMAASYGWGDDQFGCLVALWNRESGWNVTAGSPGGAYGIPQALPGSKMASAGADWLTSAATQIRWGLGYVAGRYGTPCGAWAHFQANNWY
ncbi:aggregation-promoting factor C-terminal-like domain-containing protein [Agromyces sp. NPDC055520]